MQSLIYGLVHWNEARLSLRETERASAGDAAVCGEEKSGYLFRFLEVLLDAVYIAMILKTKGVSTTHYTVDVYVAVCAALLASKAWTLYHEYDEHMAFERTVNARYFFALWDVA